MVFWRKLSRNLNKITNKENYAENMKNNLPITVKKTPKEVEDPLELRWCLRAAAGLIHGGTWGNL